MSCDASPLGSFYCQFESVFKFSCLIASQMSLITLSADRLKKVMLPFRKGLQIRHAAIICGVIWVLAILVAAPIISLRSLERRKWSDFEEVWCSESKSRSQTYWLILLAILCYFPLLLMVAFYSVILCQMKKYEERLNESGNPVRSMHRKRIIQMIWVYLVVAIVCWTPLQVLVIYRRFMSQVCEVTEQLEHVTDCNAAAADARVVQTGFLRSGRLPQVLVCLKR